MTRANPTTATKPNKMPAIDLNDNLGNEDDDVSAEFKPAPEKVATSVRALKEERRWVVLEDNDDIPPGGQFIGLNGRGYKLQAGVAANVPVAVLAILDNAIKSVAVTDPNTMRVIGWRNRKRMPYRYLTGEELADAEAGNTRIVTE